MALIAKPQTPIEISDRGSFGVPVYIQDQTTGALDLPFLSDINTTTLAADTSIDDRTVTLTTGHGAVVGNILEVADDNNGSNYIQSEILGVAGDDVTIDSPINKNYLAASSTVIISKKDMNVDGSVTPAIYAVKPLSGQVGDMVRVICAITDNAAMDFETFGGIPKLTNGIVLRVKNPDGSYRHLANFKTNGEIASYSFDTKYETNNGGGVRGFTARMTWGGQTKHGVVVRLDGNLGEELQIVIQDDLTALQNMIWIAQGSEIQGS